MGEHAQHVRFLTHVPLNFRHDFRVREHHAVVATSPAVVALGQEFPQEHSPAILLGIAAFSDLATHVIDSPLPTQAAKARRTSALAPRGQACSGCSLQRRTYSLPGTICKRYREQYKGRIRPIEEQAYRQTGTSRGTRASGAYQDHLMESRSAPLGGSYPGHQGRHDHPAQPECRVKTNKAEAAVITTTSSRAYLCTTRKKPSARASEWSAHDESYEGGTPRLDPR